MPITRGPRRGPVTFIGVLARIMHKFSTAPTKSSGVRCAPPALPDPQAGTPGLLNVLVGVSRWLTRTERAARRLPVWLKSLPSAQFGRATGSPLRNYPFDSTTARTHECTTAPQHDRTTARAHGCAPPHEFTNSRIHDLQTLRVRILAPLIGGIHGFSAHTVEGRSIWASIR